MAGPTSASQYRDVLKLINAHKNAIFEVNSDGSLRTQNFKEKLGNLGLRIAGKYDATKLQKDAKVGVAIRALFLKTGQKENSYADPKHERAYDRFFNPVALPARKSTKEIKSKTGQVFIDQSNQKFSESQKVPAARVYFHALADQFSKLATDTRYQKHTAALDGLSSKYRAAARHLKSENSEAKFGELTEDLKSVGLTLGRGDLEDFDISHGLVAWAKKNSPDDLLRYGTN